MSRSMRWMLPSVAAFVLVFGLSAMRSQAADDAAKRVTISGTVTDADGKAVEGATVSLTKPRTPAGGGGGAGGGALLAAGGNRPAPLITTKTDKDGKYTLTADKDIPDGDYSVSANSQEKGRARAAVKVKDNVADPATVDLKLAPRPAPAN